MIISNNNSSSYTQKSVDQSNAKVQAQVVNTKSKDVYESSTKSSSEKKQYDSYNTNAVKPNTPQSVAHKFELDETGVRKDYHPTWPKEIRKAFWDHDKDLTLMEKTRAPSFRINAEMTLRKILTGKPYLSPSELSDKGKFLAMLEDIKVKWKGHISSGVLPKDEEEMYEKLLIDVDELTRDI
jgi:hypothetical protein